MDGRNGVEATYILLEFVLLREVSPGTVQLPELSSTWPRPGSNGDVKQDAEFIKGLS